MIDRSQYITCPMGTIDETVTLAHTLVSGGKPKKPRAHVVEALEHLEAQVAATQAAQVAQAKQLNITTTAGVDPVLIDQVTDRAWRGFKQRLEAATTLPASDPDSADAAYALDRIFGDDGLAFLSTPYAAQLNQMKIHLAPLVGDAKEAGLRELVDRVAGPKYLAHVLAMVEPYEAMVLARAKAADPTAAVVMPAHRELQEAIVSFAIAVISSVKRGDEASLAEAKAMLLPIDNARAKAREAAGARRGKATEATPVTAPATGPADA